MPGPQMVCSMNTIPPFGIVLLLIIQCYVKNARLFSRRWEGAELDSPAPEVLDCVQSFWKKEGSPVRLCIDTAPCEV